MINENWQNDWAHTTLNVIQVVSRKQGFKFYPNDTAPREDLESFLTLEAQTIANKYEPSWNLDDPETYWAGYLYKSLMNNSRYHWSEWINADSRTPKYEAAKQANQGWARIEHILTKDDQVMQVEHRMSPIGGLPLLTPEAHYLRAEALEEKLANIHERSMPPDLMCIEAGCTRLKPPTVERCKYHQRVHLQYWAEGDRCEEQGCPDKAMRRGLCPRHYDRNRDREITAGTWQPREIPEFCTIENCGNKHESRGLCSKHYEKFRISLNPPCTAEGCDRNQYAKTLCTMHYNQMRNKDKPPCTVEGCTEPQRARSMCQPHYRESRKDKT